MKNILNWKPISKEGKISSDHYCRFCGVDFQTKEYTRSVADGDEYSDTRILSPYKSILGKYSACPTCIKKHGLDKLEKQVAIHWSTEICILNSEIELIKKELDFKIMKDRKEAGISEMKRLTQLIMVTDNKEEIAFLHQQIYDIYQSIQHSCGCDWGDAHKEYLRRKEIVANIMQDVERKKNTKYSYCD